MIKEGYVFLQILNNYFGVGGEEKNNILIHAMGTRQRMLDTSAPGQFGTRTFLHQDRSAPGQFGTYVRQFGTRTILIHCIQQSSDIVKLKEVFLPHPFYNVSGLLLKIFSIWLAHTLGSGIDSKNH